MKRIKFILGLGVSGLAVVIVLQYESIATLRAENSALRSKYDQLSQAQAARESNANASATGNDLNAEQIAELLKLRGEVTQLRGMTNDIGTLRQQNDALRVSLKAKAGSTAQPSDVPARKSPDDALPQDIHPQNTWAFRGYGTPDATVESMLWSATHGDTPGFLAGLSPEMLEKFQKDFGQKDFAEEVKKNPIEEFRVLDRQTVSDDEMVVTIYTSHLDNNNTPHNSTEDSHFKKIDGQWKVFEPKEQPSP